MGKITKVDPNKLVEISEDEALEALKDPKKLAELEEAIEFARKAFPDRDIEQGNAWRFLQKAKARLMS